MHPALTYVVVSGNSGAGKSTLLREMKTRLEGLGVAAVEACDERRFHHPFLQRMFDDPDHWALPIQINFVTQRAAHVLRTAETSAPGSILLMERCLWEDRLFFEYYVRREKISARLREPYRGLLSALVALTPRPFLAVYLKARTETLYRRLETAMKTGDRPVELAGDRLYQYLENMNALYRAWPDEIRRIAEHFLELDIDAPGYSPQEVVDRVCSLLPTPAIHTG